MSQRGLLVPVFAFCLTANATEAVYFSIPSPDSPGFGIEASANDQADCQQGKYQRCFDRGLIVSSLQDSAYDLGEISDSQLSIGKKHISVDFTQYDQGAASEFNFSLDLTRDKNDLFAGDIIIVAEDVMGKEISTRRYSFSDVALAFKPKPINEVPLPAGAFLFGSALAALGLIGRRQESDHSHHH
ncbi:MAG TPA: VPLPA-CTERM sorting domain-containing protein [Porticoccus sp.]|nr:VPLPA-CTERM sorting domain-containing protein [Porticoccus sp.]